LSLCSSLLAQDKATALSQSSRGLARLQRACETAKRSLSSSTSATIEIDSLVTDVDFNVSLTRAKFEELNAKLFQDCMDTVTAVLKDAGVKNSEVTDIVLVGGSTRVPILQTKVRLHEERSDELTTPSQATKIARARTSL